MKHKKVDKIINDTEFLVQKRTGGWPGWNVYARHPKWSKWSTVIEQEKKPRLTMKLKEKIIKAAIEEQENWRHNQPMWLELSRVFKCIQEYIHDFGFIFLRNEAVSNIVIKNLEDKCEDPKINIALQRLLDAMTEYNKYRCLENSLKPTKIKL